MAGRYPILSGQTDEAYEARRNHTPYPRSVPWDLVKDHEEQAYTEQLPDQPSLCRPVDPPVRLTTQA